MNVRRSQAVGDICRSAGVTCKHGRGVTSRRLTSGYGVVAARLHGAAGDTCIPTHAGISFFVSCHVHPSHSSKLRSVLCATVRGALPIIGKLNNRSVRLVWSIYFYGIGFSSQHTGILHRKRFFDIGGTRLLRLCSVPLVPPARPRKANSPCFLLLRVV